MLGAASRPPSKPMPIPHLTAALADEAELLAEAKTRPAAFAAVYDFYFARIYNYTRYRVGDATLADDLTSEIFERVWRHLDTYRPDRGPFAGWLFGIARNTVNATLRRQRARRWLSLEALAQQPSAGPRPEEAAAQAEAERALLAAVGRLGEREREVLALKFTSGLGNHAIGAVLGLNAGHVGVILHRAIRRLRLALEHEGESP
jgi:RNA polymerase sigma-70 factor (ECF subfamily)